MRIIRLHRWDLEYSEAVAVQERLAARVEEWPPLSRAETVAGADVSGGRTGDWIAAAVVVMRLADMTVLEVGRARLRATWPYVPGCLSFRETPVVLEALRQLRIRPDVLLCDGHGRAHPRRFGLACHVGLAVGAATVGCAKSLLVGEQIGALGRARGSRAPLVDMGERVGTVLRTRADVRPVYVSVGHRIDLPSAERWVLASTAGCRLPEPLRLAHREVTVLKRELTSRGHS